LSHGQHGHTRLTTAWTWGKPPPFPYGILCGWPWKLHSNGFSLLRLPNGSFEIAPNWTPATLEPHNFASRPRIPCGLKQSYSSHRELSNGMSHAPYSQVNRVDSRLFVVRNQIGSLTPDPSIGHNLCFRCSNEQCKFILNIYVLRAF
jgi:hypothetical protein